MKCPKCPQCGSEDTYLIDNRDEVNADNLDEDEDSDALFLGCENCDYYEEIEREEE